MKKHIFLSLFLLSTGLLSAQEAFDLLRNNSSEIHGTARAVAMANAFGALGGDITAIGINPAGIGIYRSSEASYSQQVNINRNEADFHGLITNEKRVHTMPSAFGFVESYNSDNEEGIVNFNWAITYNRYRNFYNNTLVEGSDRSVSLLDNIDVNNESINQGMNLPYMAYNAYLFNPDKEGIYRSILREGQRIDNELYQTESGFAQEWDFSVGLNYAYWLYFGLTVKVKTLKYVTEACYSEFLGLPEYSLTNKLETRGTGAGVNVGVIVRPIPALRIGLAYHSPTFFNLTDYSQATLKSFSVEDGEGRISNHTVNTDYNSYGYRQETPHEFVASVAGQLGMKGFISADFQMSSTRTMRMSDQYGKPYNDVNSDIKDFFRNQYQCRVGFECRFTSSFSGRLGYAYTSSPVNSQVEGENYWVYTPTVTPHYTLPLHSHTITGGLGWRIGNAMFLDFACMDNLTNAHLYPFYNHTPLGDENFANVKGNHLTFVGTVGFKF